MKEERERRLRVGLVGCGAFANAALIPAMKYAPIDLLAVCDRDQDRARATARTAGAESVYTDIETMLTGETLDAVILAVGPHIYPDLTAKALRAGVHVMVEKPPAVSIEEARSMQQAAATAGRQLGVGFMKRFATGYRMAKELVTTAEFGGITHVSARISTGVWTPAWAQSLTPLAFVLDHSIHFMDLVQFFCGPVRWVCAASSRSGENRFGFAVVMEFKSGATGVLELSNFETRGVPNERIQLMGGRGRSVTVENVSRVIYGREAAPMEHGRKFGVDTDRVVWEPNMTNISQENSSLVHMGYAGEMRNLANCLLEDRPLSPDIGDGIAALELAHAVLQSGGRRIDLHSSSGQF